MTSLQVHRIFSIPIIQFEFDKHLQYNFPIIPKSVKKPKEWIEDLYTSFPNILDDDEYVNFEVRDKLKKDLQECINKQLTQLGMPNFSDYSQFWYNVYYENQGQEIHNHLPHCGVKNAYWSGIYYYNTFSPTVFIREASLWKTQVFFGQETCFLREFYHDKWAPSVKSGDIILFPPYLEHCVYPVNEVNRVRMTFSFNLDI